MLHPIDTPRLRLRCVLQADAAATSRLITPDVSRWVAYWPFPFTLAMAEERIAAVLKWASSGKMLPYAVIEKASDALIGWVMFTRDGDNPKRASFGYWLGEAYHGKGYMKELAPVALAEAFTLLDVDVIEAAAQPENAASLAIMRRCGMHFIKESMLYAPARARDELCHFYEIARP